MAFIISSQVANHGALVPGASTSAMMFGTSIGHLLRSCVGGLVHVSTAYAQAQALVFVKRGGATVERQQLVFDTDGEGRDPSW